MTAFVNIRMTDPKVLVDPRLKALIDKLVMLNPKLVFVQPKQVIEFEYDVSFNFAKAKEKHKAPDDCKYIRSMSVYEDTQKVGVVGAYFVIPYIVLQLNYLAQKPTFVHFWGQLDMQEVEFEKGVDYLHMGWDEYSQAYMYFVNFRQSNLIVFVQNLKIVSAVGDVVVA